MTARLLHADRNAARRLVPSLVHDLNADANPVDVICAVWADRRDDRTVAASHVLRIDTVRRMRSAR